MKHSPLFKISVLVTAMMFAGGLAAQAAADLNNLDTYCASQPGMNSSNPTLYIKGKISGCKSGYRFGYNDGFNYWPKRDQQKCSATHVADKNAPVPAASAQNQSQMKLLGEDRGCFDFYEIGFTAGDLDLVTDPTSNDCPASLKKTSGDFAGAFTQGCSFGFREGEAGNDLPGRCAATADNYLYNSGPYVDGCKQGYNAGKAAATPPAPVYAVDHALIVPFAGLSSYDVGLATYINAVYKWSIGLAALAAVFQIVYGGTLYILAAGSLYSQEEATGKIKNAATGLLLLVSITLILQVINPNLALITPSGQCVSNAPGCNAPPVPWYQRIANTAAYLTPGSSLITH